MKLKPILALIACLAFIPGCAPQKSTTLVFPDSGFSIDPLRTKEIPEKNLMMFLPKRDGFSASVNVQVMDWTTPIAEYAKEAQQQIKALKGIVVSEKQISAAEWIVEYQADLGNGTMRFYTRGILVSGRLYVATATSLDKHWAEDAAVLKQCVESLKPIVPTSR